MPFLPQFSAALTLSLALGLPGSALGGDFADPFDTAGLTEAGPGGSVAWTGRDVCRVTNGTAAMTLAEVVDQALCSNPQTRLAWANARAQAALVGSATSSYLPSLSASAARSHNLNSGGSANHYDQTTASLSASYLLYDFGGRAATLESARQLLSALVASQDATLQAVFLAAVQAYYQWHANEAAVAAAFEAERAAMASLKAATARYQIGSGTPADRLQAQTAASQATLARIQAEGNARTALGTLANALGRDAQDAPALVPPAAVAPNAEGERDISRLIADAKRSRPDLAAAEAQVKAAQANIDAVRAGGLPTISLVGSHSYNNSGLTDPTRGSSIGVALSVPLFSGFNTTYKIRNAEAQLDAKIAQREQVDRQVSLDVWRTYHALTTSAESVRASADLLASAVESERVAAGRYRAGVGGILDLLNAQSALANARMQSIQAAYNWRIAKASLAQAMGRLDFALLDNADTTSSKKASSP
jgi:TolC family type I secretion outer membrane protein